MPDYIQALLIEQRRKKMEDAKNIPPAQSPRRNLPEYVLQMQQANAKQAAQVAQMAESTPGATENLPSSAGESVVVPEPNMQMTTNPSETKIFEELKSFISLFFLQDNIEDALMRIFAAITASVNVSVLELMFIDKEQEVVFLFSVSEKGALPGEEFLAYENTPLGGFLNAAQPAVVPDLLTKKEYIFTSIVSEYNLKSLIQLPCTTAFGFLGFLNLYSNELDAFTFEDRDYCQIFANMTAVYLENVNMREKLKMTKSSAPAPKRADVQLSRYLEHELQYPIEELKKTAIKMGDKKLGRLAPKQSEYLDSILISLDGAKKKVDQLQEYLCVVSGKIVPELKRVEVYKIFLDIQTAIAPLLEGKSVRMLMEVDKKFPPIIADYKLLKRVLYAICENAIDKTKIGGVFRLGVYNEKGKAEIIVCDFGVEPIAKDDYVNLFTPFAFFEHTLSSNRGKMFLNMPLVKIYTELMGGKISVESSKEDGTTFSVFLPLA